MCVKLAAEEPIISGKPVKVTVTFTSDKDQELIVSLTSVLPDVIFENPVSQENKSADDQGKGYVAWRSIKAKANVPNTFTCMVRFPKNGRYELRAGVDNGGRGISAMSIMTIDNSPEGGKVYLLGTPVAETYGPAPTYNGPTFTVVPSPTPWPTPVFATPTYITTPTPSSPGYPPPGQSATAMPPAKAIPTSPPTLPAYPHPTK